VDPEKYQPLDVPIRWDLSYIGTYSDDRQPTVEKLLNAVARQLPHRRFCVAGPQYPADLDWPDNVERIDHVPPTEHPAFYAASRFTLNVTRADMIEAGWSPSVRLFEAAACGTPIISDVWQGLDQLLQPGKEIFLARSADDVVAALEGLSAGQAQAVGQAARSRVLHEHTASHRAEELERHLFEAGLTGHAAEPEGRLFA
jgi:spore maturation protein CgeB